MPDYTREQVLEAAKRELARRELAERRAVEQQAAKDEIARRKSEREEIASKTAENVNRVIRERLAQDVSPAESAYRGGVQTATAGFSDEAKGVLDALGINVADVVGSATNPAVAAATIGNAAANVVQQGLEETKRKYVEGREGERLANVVAQEANPPYYTAGEVAGGVASAIMPGGVAATGARAARAGYGIGRAALTGAMSGAAGAIGTSEADLTEGEIAQAGKDAAIGAVTGGALGGGIGVAGKLAVPAARRVSGYARRAREAITGAKGNVPVADKIAAENMARKVASRADDIEFASQSGSRESFYKKSQELVGKWDEMLSGAGQKESLAMRPSQMTGDPEIALQEFTARNLPGNRTKLIESEQKQLEQGARILDMYVDGIAARPKSLGRSDVGDQVSAALEKHIENLRSARSRVAGELYRKAEQASGNRRVVPTDNTQAVMESIVKESHMGPGKLSAPVEESLQKIQKAGSRTGRITISQMQNLRSVWGKVASGDLNVIEGMKNANERRIARNILKAIDDDLEVASKSAAAGESARFLREANGAWREYSKPIDDAATDTVRRLLKVSDDAGDTVTTKLMRSSPDQIRGVFRVLNKAEPDTARQLRAQMFDDILTRAGKPIRGDESSTGARFFSPYRAYQLLTDPKQETRQRLLAAFEGDNKAKSALVEMIELTKRLQFGPNIKGSSTAPQLAEAIADSGLAAASASAGAAVGGPAGIAIANMTRFVFGTLRKSKDMSRVLSSPENIAVFNDALKIALKKKLPAKPVLQRISALAGRLEGMGVIGIDNPLATQDEEDQQ